MSEFKCKICNGHCKELFTALVLTRHSVTYFQCANCKFIQTENPYWLNEAYGSAISSMDVGLVYRNNMMVKAIVPILKEYFDYKAKFLDYAGGYGLFVRLMRDLGFDFYRQDIYCQNIFAAYLDVTDLPEETRFEAVTAFEVFEHLVDPLQEIRHMFKYADTIVFSTELQPEKPLVSSGDWWYFVPESGQHISFYTLSSLSRIAEALNCRIYSNNANLHILTKKRLKSDPFKIGKTTSGGKPSIFSSMLMKMLLIFYRNNKVSRPIELESLLQRDFEVAKRKSLQNL